MSDSFVMYRSFHEALKELSREQYGNVMYAINEYALNGTTTEDLSGIEKAVFLMAKPQLDANRLRRENGAQGGRPRKDNQKPMVNEIENQEKPMVIENCENEKPNENANENLNGNANTHTENTCVPAYIPDPNKKYDKALTLDLFNAILKHNTSTEKDRMVPITKDINTFSQKEMRELIGTIGPQQEGNNVRETLQNFLKVCRSDTWMKSHTWSNFCKHYTDYTPEFFTLERYLNAEPQTDDASKKPENAFFFAHKDDPDFHVETFQAHIDDWKAEGRPDGADYLALQNKWEAENAD